MTLVKSEKFILDATAGFRMMWFNKDHPNCVYLDSRPECEPDVVGDFRDLNQFKDESFRLIVFDPPHILRSTKACSSKMAKDFGFLSPDNWVKDIYLGFREMFRVLKPYGVLLFKWSTLYISSDKLIRLSPIKPLFYQISANISKTPSGKKAGQHTKTIWFCFMKIPEEEKH